MWFWPTGFAASETTQHDALNNDGRGRLRSSLCLHQRGDALAHVLRLRLDR